MKSTMRSLFRISLFALCLALPTGALADGAPTSADIKRAAESYDMGRERFREGQYIEAAEMFESADAAAPSAAAIRLAIFARKEAGHMDRALTLAALALDRHSGEAQLSEEAQAVIDENGGQFAKVAVTCDEPCELLLDNRIVHGAARTNRIVYMNPGTSTFVASWSDNRTQSESVSAEAAGEAEVAFFAPEVPVSDTGPQQQEGSDAPQDTEEKKGWHPAVFYTGLGLTVAGGVASIALGLNAKNNPGTQAVIDNCEKGETECPEYRQGVRNQTYANVALGATAAFAVFTVTSAFLTDFSGKDDTALNKLRFKKGNVLVQPVLAVGEGASIGAVGTF